MVVRIGSADNATVPVSIGNNFRAHRTNHWTKYSGANAISTFFRCKCTGLTPDQIRRVGDLLLRDPLEGTKYVPPNFKTPLMRAILKRLGVIP